MKLKLPTVKEIVPKVFVVTMDNQFDLAMMFCRYQEFYESPDMSGKKFTFVEFMRYYANKWGKPRGSFSYPYDWNGFNIPGQILKKCMESHFPFESSNYLEYRNEYDYLMSMTVQKILTKTGDKWDFYLIGVHTGTTEREKAGLVSHEVAHGLYYMNKAYSIKVDALLGYMNKRTKDYVKKALLKKGYAKHTLLDELNAHLATGLTCNMNPVKLKREMKTFFNLLKEFYPNVTRDDSKYKPIKKGKKK